MRRIGCLFCMMLILCGCSEQLSETGVRFRKRILESNGCSFNMSIYANYGSDAYEFVVFCKADAYGTLSFEIIEPTSISGIGGQFDVGSGQLMFQDVVLALPSLADGEIMPVYAPWIFLNTVRTGYIKDEGKQNALVVLTIMDSFEDDALLLRVYMNTDELPVACDVFWQGRSVLSFCHRKRH